MFKLKIKNTNKIFILAIKKYFLKLKTIVLQNQYIKIVRLKTTT